MRVPCARWWGVAHRYGVKGIGDQKELADGVVQFLAANYRHGRKRRQAAQAALPGVMAADSGDCVPAPQTMAWSTGNIAPLRGFRSPHTALGQIGCPGAIRSC